MIIDELKVKLSTETLDMVIEIKPYLSFIEKKMLVDSVVESSIIVDEVNNIMLIDNFHKILMSELAIISNYTNLEFSDNTIEEYDYLVENDINKWILEHIKSSEIDFIYKLINEELEQKIKINNSLEIIVANGIQKFIDKIPTDKQLKSLIKSLVKDLNKFNWDKIPELKKMFNIFDESKNKEI